MTTTKEEMRNVLKDELKYAEFPVSSIMSLASELPDGPATKFVTDDLTVTAMELASSDNELDFPYESVDELVDEAITIMDSNDYFEENIENDE